MADPTRLIEEDGEHGRDTVGRELLLAARREGVPPSERDRLWTAVAAAALVAPAIAVPASAASGTTTAATAGGATALAKVTVAAIVIGAASLAGYRASRPAPSPRVVAPAVAKLPAPESPREPSPPRASAPEPVRVQRAPAPARALPPSHLAAEGRLVVEARRALREGDAAGALRQLEAGRAAFAGGALLQEREALTIEALARTGRADAAAARADAFLRAYPHSPHASAIRVFATP